MPCATAHVAEQVGQRLPELCPYSHLVRPATECAPACQCHIPTLSAYPQERHQRATQAIARLCIFSGVCHHDVSSRAGDIIHLAGAFSP